MRNFHLQVHLLGVRPMVSAVAVSCQYAILKISLKENRGDVPPHMGYISRKALVNIWLAEQVRMKA